MLENTKDAFAFMGRIIHLRKSFVNPFFCKFPELFP